jgi:hypothetical protein
MIAINRLRGGRSDYRLVVASGKDESRRAAGTRYTGSGGVKPRPRCRRCERIAEPMVRIRSPPAASQERTSHRVTRRNVTSGGLMNEKKDAEEGNDADRKVNVKHPAPVVIIGQPAAEGGAGDRPDHGSGTPYRHRLAMPLGRVDAQQHGLRQWHQCRAAYPLQQAKEDHLGKAVGQAAQRRGHGKAGDRDQKDPFDAEGASQPVSGVMIAAATI